MIEICTCKHPIGFRESFRLFSLHFHQTFKGKQISVIGVGTNIAVYVPAIGADAVKVLTNRFALTLTWEKVVDILDTAVI